MRLFAILATTAALVALSSTAPTLITKHILKTILFSPFRNRVLIVKPISLPQLPFVVPTSFPILSSLFNQKKPEEPVVVEEEAPHVGGVTTVLHPLSEHYHHYDLPSYTEVHQHAPEVHHHVVQAVHDLPEVTIDEDPNKVEYIPDVVSPVTAVTSQGGSSSVHTVYPAPVPAPLPAPLPAPVPSTGNEVDGLLPPATERPPVPFQQYGLPIVVSELSAGSSSSSSSHAETNADLDLEAKYVAVNLGVRHEAPLPGYDHSVVIENLEPAPEHPDQGATEADFRSSV